MVNIYLLEDVFNDRFWYFMYHVNRIIVNYDI